MKKYEPRGIQAIAPSALFGLFEEIENPSNTETDDATIVTIRGPLSQHTGWWGDSYESIRARVAEACTKAAPVVILRIDSPGGEVAGCFDAARAIRAACDVAQKQLLVHVEGQCSSAAYALACTADRIMASRTADVGSIGVIAARIDVTRADAQSGVEVALVTSGARKADWNPHSPLSPEELAAHQAEVDGLAAEFFELVAAWRKLTTEKIAALEAASFRGSAAVQAGLVDELGSFDHLLASLGGAQQEEAMPKDNDEMREALRSIAEDEERDEEERARARRALAAWDAEEEPDAEEDEKEPEAEEDEPEDDDEEAKAAASGTVSAATAGAIAAYGSDVETRLAKLERATAAKERQALIAAHGGVTPELGKILATKPLGEVKALLNALPKPPRKPKLGDAAATATVAGTRGTGTASRLPPAQAKLMDRAMGLEKPKIGVVKRGGVLLLGAPIEEGGE